MRLNRTTFSMNGRASRSEPMTAGGQVQRAAGRLTMRNRRDSGNTLVEILVVVGVLAILSTAVAGAIAVVFRTESGVTATVASSHDVQQAINYFESDVHSGPVAVAGWIEDGSGCAEGTDNLIRFDTGTARVAYRETVQFGYKRIDRYICEQDPVTGSWSESSVVNIVDSLPETATPSITPILAADPNYVREVRLSLPYANREVEIIAAPRASTRISTSIGFCGTDPLTASQDFGGFLLGDVELQGGTLEGTLVVGGTLTWTNDLSLTSKNNSFDGVALYAETIDWGEGGAVLDVELGDVWIRNPFVVDGKQVYESDPNTGNVIAVKSSGSVSAIPADETISFETAQESFVGCSSALVSPSIPGQLQGFLGANCRDDFDPDSESGDTVCLKSNEQQILTIPDDDLDQLDGMDLTGVSQNHPVVINVIDADEDGIIVELTDVRWSTGASKNVIWNFPNAEEIQINSDLRGSILAPHADLTTDLGSDGEVLGAIIAARWTHISGSVVNDSNNRFDNAMEWSE